MTVEVYLASGSPRRRKILQDLGWTVHIISVTTDERKYDYETPEEYVRRAAEEKNRAAVEIMPAAQFPIISADTCVVIDNCVSGKPQDVDEAYQMLRRLSGREHRVLTAVSVSFQGACKTAVSESKVSFAELSDENIRAYIKTGEPMDKAGAYGIQGIGGMFVRHLDGSFSGVTGLPVSETCCLVGTFLNSSLTVKN